MGLESPKKAQKGLFRPFQGLFWLFSGLPFQLSIFGVPFPPPYSKEKQAPRTENTELVVIRTLDNSQRDVPVYVVFLQGVLTVPVDCLCQWAVWPSETFPQGVLTVPVGCLCQWAVWPSETFPQGVLWCQCSSRPTQGRKRRSAQVPVPARAQI